jgi:predicted HicB family RNase H-like nuclease
MKKPVEYYLSLPYKIEIMPIPKEKGGGYIASLPEVGSYAIVGDGDTENKALKQLKQSMRKRFSSYIKKGISIPEPMPEKEHYSGRFVLRIPKSLHARLASAAYTEGSSLNTYIITLLAGEHSGNFSEERLMEKLKGVLTDFVEDSNESRKEVIHHHHFVSIDDAVTDYDPGKPEIQLGGINEGINATY